MSVKAIQKQLIAAIAMLLVATIALGSSTYAWFAMSRTVDASVANVNIKGDGVLLLIEGGDTVAAGTSASKTFTANELALYPATHGRLQNLDAVSVESNWYYGYSNSADSATINSDTMTNLSRTNFGNYISVTEFTVTLDSSSGLNSASDLRVSSISIKDSSGADVTDSGLHVLVAGTDNYVEFKKAATLYDDQGTDAPTPADATVGNAMTTAIAAGVAKTGTYASVPVKVYIWIDGGESVITSANMVEGGAVDLKGIYGTGLTVSLTLDVNPVEMS